MRNEAIEIGSNALRGTVLFLEQNGWTLAVDARAIDSLDLVEEQDVSTDLFSRKASTFVGLTGGDDPRPIWSLPRLLADPLDPTTVMFARIRSAGRVVPIALWAGRTLQIKAIDRSQRTALPPGVTSPIGVFSGVIRMDTDRDEGQSHEYALLLNLDRLLSLKELERGEKALQKRTSRSPRVG